jgi:hypothetical protein
MSSSGDYSNNVGQCAVREGNQTKKYVTASPSMDAAAKEIWKELVSNKMTATAEVGSFLSGRV